jgi:hypothetical protein
MSEYHISRPNGESTYCGISLMREFTPTVDPSTVDERGWTPDGARVCDRCLRNWRKSS